MQGTKPVVMTGFLKHLKINHAMKEVNIRNKKHTGGARSYGTSYTWSCPACNYKSNSYRTALIWDKANVTCEQCQNEFILLNTDEDTNSKSK